MKSYFRERTHFNPFLLISSDIKIRFLKFSCSKTKGIALDKFDEIIGLLPVHAEADRCFKLEYSKLVQNLFIGACRAIKSFIISLRYPAE